MALRKKAASLQRYAGVSLGGGKTDRTSVAVFEWYADPGRLFLRGLRERVKSDGKISGDEALFQILVTEEAPLHTVAFDVPLQLPKCMRCELVCPGYERCKLPEIRWLWDQHERSIKRKRPAKLFTPYTERCSDAYLVNEFDEDFSVQHALGSNLAPLTARAHFLKRRLQAETPAVELIEYLPKLSLWRIGRPLRIPKSYLLFHRHAIDSDEARRYVIKTIVERKIAFIYQQDAKTLVDSPWAFDAFLGGLTAHLAARRQTEARPPGFPKSEAWIAFPRETIEWF
jgi:hypothetical protein